MSYATNDSELFSISKIADQLNTKPGIGKVVYWQRDMKENIREFMNNNIGDCDIFVLFCSPDAKESKHVKEEWMAADQLGKYIIPVFTNKKYIPPLLSAKLGVTFDIFKQDKAPQQIYDLIKKKYPDVDKKIDPDNKIEDKDDDKAKPSSSIDINRKYQYHMKTGKYYLESNQFNDALDSFKAAKIISKELFDAEKTIQVSEYILQAERKIENPDTQEYSIDEFKEEEEVKVEEIIDDEEFIKEDIKDEAEYIEEEEVMEGYHAIYVRISKIRDLLFDGEVKLRLSGEARNTLAYFLDVKVNEGIKEKINVLPRNSKGERKGHLKRITLMKKDFENSDDINLQKYQSKYIRVSKIRALLREGNIIIRVARNAWNLLIYHLDKKVTEGIKQIIDNMPRKVKGDRKGQLRYITIQKKDFDSIL